MDRAYYAADIGAFVDSDEIYVLGVLTKRHGFALEPASRDAWLEEIRIMKRTLAPYRQHGKVYFEFGIPRLGKRIDVLVIIDSIIFVIEFKVGEHEFPAHAKDQVWDYALDLKNFHESSHRRLVVPILIATNASGESPQEIPEVGPDQSTEPICGGANALPSIIQSVIRQFNARPIEIDDWEQGRYCPTPTIIEAATALYGGHSVGEISRSDAGAVNLRETSEAISRIIEEAREGSRKVLCFLTGVPGAGKTLVGLNIANTHRDQHNELYSVFLSGNGPLVHILCEALARDTVIRERSAGRKVKKGDIERQVGSFIQNIHHFRDECIRDPSPPIEHVALFDEAQRAWNLERTADFMRRKKGKLNFNCSEPEFLISCMDRHPDWAVIVCLVGGGQEINTGEAGISEWIDSLIRAYPNWDMVVSPRLTDSEYAAGQAMDRLRAQTRVRFQDELHLSVSMRSFRAERVSLFVKQMLDLNRSNARDTLQDIANRYPIVLTRDLDIGRQWLRAHARGSERYGIVASSEGLRLKPCGIDVRSPTDPVNWFLGSKSDVRSSYYLEDVATEFVVQGLELDWACVVWDADFRYSPTGWGHWSFRGHRWIRIGSSERQAYLKNAYRVLLTRARQGMVIVVPKGDRSDPTRPPEFYDNTFEYLLSTGIQRL